MRKFAILGASVAALTLVPTLSSADTVIIDPSVDTWVMEQPDADGVVIEGDVLVGSELPGTATIIGVPDNNKFGYVVVGKKRVLVERNTRKVIKVY